MTLNVDGNLLVGVQVGVVVGAIFGMCLGIALCKFLKVEKVGDADLRAPREKQRVRGLKVSGPTPDPDVQKARIRQSLEASEHQADALITKNQDRIDSLVLVAMSQCEPLISKWGVTREEVQATLHDSIRRAMVGATVSSNLVGVCEPSGEEDLPFVVTAEIGAEDQSVAEIEIEIMIDLASRSIPVFEMPVTV